MMDKWTIAITLMVIFVSLSISIVLFLLGSECWEKTRQLKDAERRMNLRDHDVIRILFRKTPRR